MSNIVSGSISFRPKITYDSSLVLYLDAANRSSYPGSGTIWTDLTINKNDGTLTNSPTFNSSNGDSIVFDGINQYISRAYTSTISAPNTHSLECWFNITTIPAAGSNILIRGGTGTDQQYGMFVGILGNVTYTYYDSSIPAFGTKSSTFRFTTNTWGHCIMVKNGTSLSIYINGILDSTHTVVTTVPSTFTTLGIGGGTSAQYYTGRIATVQIYNKALSATEVLQNYNALRGRFGL